MRLRTKLLFLFLASGAFLGAQGLFAAWGLRTVGRDVDGLQRYTQTDDLCGQVKTELARLPTPHMLGQEGAGARGALIEHADRVIVLSRMLERLTSSPSSRDAIQRVVLTAQAYRGAGRAYVDAVEAGRAAFPERDAVDRAHAAIIVVDAVIEPVGHEARLATQAVGRRADVLDTWVTVGGLGLAVLATVVGAFVLARLTAHPVVKLARAAREVGAGKLDTVVEVRTTDELGDLARAFNEMTERLRSVYGGLEGEVKKRTAELRQREQELERERRLAAIGRLAAGVAHEVSNPLTVIAGAAEGLRDRARDPSLAAVPEFADFPDYLQTIEDEAYRLKRVVRRLLDFSRAKPTVMAPLDLAEVVGDAVALARLDKRAREHPIKLEPADRAPGPTASGTAAAAGAAGPARFPVRGDADALKEALLNLLFNALHAVQQGGAVVVRLLREGDVVAVEVQDDGVGIAPEHVERLFEPFFTTGKEGEGTGLGLALVHETVERHGGAIRARSAGRGAGATFRITLPLDRGEPLQPGRSRPAPASDLT